MKVQGQRQELQDKVTASEATLADLENQKQQFAAQAHQSLQVCHCKLLVVVVVVQQCQCTPHAA